MTELSLYTKLIDSAYKLFTERCDKLPLYHGNDIPEYLPPAEGTDLEHISFRRADISKQAVSQLITELKNDWKIHLSGFGMMLDGKLVCEYYPAYNTPVCRHVAFSVSKSVVAMAVGIAEEQGLLNLEEKLCDIFLSHNGIFLKHGMKNVTIRHLLTMTAGVTFDELSSFFSPDWCRSYMGSDLGFEPGSDFAYNSLNTYMLVAAITKKSGKRFIDYINEFLFAPMGIHDITWDKCPQGIEKGGWGMKLSIPDMLKLGQLYLNNGIWTVNGVKCRLVPEKWVKESLVCHVPIRDDKLVRGYGYHIWLLKNGAFLYNGVFGQNVYVCPDRKLIIATTASAYALFPDENLTGCLCRFSGNDANFKRDTIKNTMKRNFFSRNNDNLSVQFYASEKAAFSNTKKQVSQSECQKLRYLAPYFGKTYCFDEYASALVPFSTQIFYSNFMSGIEQIMFDREREMPVMHVTDDGVTYHILLGFGSGVYRQQTLCVNGKEYRISTHCIVSFTEERRLNLEVQIFFPEEIADKKLLLFFDGDELEFQASETPDILRFSKLFIGEKKMLRTRKMEQINIPNYIKYKLNRLVATKVTGHMIE